MTQTQTIAHKLAVAFSNVIKSWLTPQQIKSVNAWNANNKTGGCASGDYCDSNMAMDAAFNEVMGKPFTFWNEEIPASQEQNSKDTELVNQAWAIAKESYFFTN